MSLKPSISDLGNETFKWKHKHDFSSIVFTLDELYSQRI
jgi:hypothetical protein